MPYISSMLVDTKREYAPCRVAKKKGRLSLVHSDHYVIVLKLKDLPKRKMTKVTTSYWNPKKTEGWERYKAMTEGMKAEADDVIEDDDLPIEKVMEELGKLQDSIKFRAFGKTKPPTKTARLERRDKASQGMDEQERAKKLLEIQSQQIEEEINKIKLMRNGKMAKIFKMKEIVAGSKKDKHEAHAVRNDKGELVFSNEEINKVNLKHCLKTFINKEPHKEAKQAVTIKELAHEHRMKEYSLDDFEITKDKFDDAVHELARKIKRSYDFLTRAGKGFKNSVFKLVRRMIKVEEFLKSSMRPYCVSFGKGRVLLKTFTTTDTCT